MSEKKSEIKARKEVLKKCSRIVVKVGTRLLTDCSRIPSLISQVVMLRERGFKVMLVSSGAVGMGLKSLDMIKRPMKLPQIQALAAIGQSKLMAAYERECQKYGFHAAQLLLTADGLKGRTRHLNILNCINSLWSNGVLPIANENDTVAVEELKFGDNDILAALLSTMTRSELTIVLTTIDGLQRKMNKKDGDRISLVRKIDDTVRNYANDTDDNDFSLGGMISKIRAAEMVVSAGEYLWIADGRDERIIERIINGEDVGTLFIPEKKKQMQSRKRWLGFFSEANGQLIIDAGASRALKERGKSLLPSGISGVRGPFMRGDTVDIYDIKGKRFARGLVNYSADEVRRIAGRQSKDIASLLDYSSDDEVVHRDNMMIF